MVPEATCVCFCQKCSFFPQFTAAVKPPCLMKRRLKSEKNLNKKSPHGMQAESGWVNCPSSFLHDGLNLVQDRPWVSAVADLDRDEGGLLGDLGFETTTPPRSSVTSWLSVTQAPPRTSDPGTENVVLSPHPLVSACSRRGSQRPDVGGHSLLPQLLKHGPWTRKPRSPLPVENTVQFTAAKSSQSKS